MDLGKWTLTKGRLMYQQDDNADYIPTPEEIEIGKAREKKIALQKMRLRAGPSQPRGRGQIQWIFSKRWGRSGKPHFT